MSIDWVLPTGSELLSVVVVRIKRQFNYLMIPSERSTQDLQKEVGKLAYLTDWIGMLVEEAQNDSRQVDTFVTDWQEYAQTALKEATRLLDEFEKASETFIDGTLRYRYNRRAMGTIKDIQGLTRQGFHFGGYYDVYCSNIRANDNLPSTRPRGAVVFPSRALVIERIEDALASGSVRVVGVCGMGGVGKTTLLKDFTMMIMAEKSYDWVAMANVSRNPDIKMIQGEIADALGLSDMKNKETSRGRAELLHTRLENDERNKKKVLIILDDLWEGLDLKSVGIPFGTDNKTMGCKLLLTSRNRGTLDRMVCDRVFRLDGLPAEEAKILFERIVGDKVHDDAFKPLVEAALHKCAGFPLLIVAMAKRLKNADLYEWMDTLTKIANSEDRGFSELIIHLLLWSYDRLHDEEKSLLLLCATCKGSKPSFEDLVKESVASGLLSQDSQGARDKLRLLIRQLEAAGLLMDSEEADGFKIHDMVRDIIVSVASKDRRLLVLDDKNN